MKVKDLSIVGDFASGVFVRRQRKEDVWSHLNRMDVPDVRQSGPTIHAQRNVSS